MWNGLPTISPPLFSGLDLLLGVFPFAGGCFNADGGPVPIDGAGDVTDFTMAQFTDEMDFRIKYKKIGEQPFGMPAGISVFMANFNSGYYFWW